MLPERTLPFCASDAIPWGAIGSGWEKAYNLVDPARPIRISASGPNQLADLEPVCHHEKPSTVESHFRITNPGVHWPLKALARRDLPCERCSVPERSGNNRGDEGERSGRQKLAPITADRSASLATGTGSPVLSSPMWMGQVPQKWLKSPWLEPASEGRRNRHGL